MNDVNLIAGEDSPFEPWVRDAVRALRDERDALLRELRIWKPKAPQCPRCHSTEVGHSSQHLVGGINPGWTCRR